MPKLYLLSNSFSLSVFAILAIIFTMSFILKKNKTKLSYYMSFLCLTAFLKIVTVFIQISFISDNNIILYYVYYVSLYAIVIINIIFTYEYNKEYISCYIKPFIFYIFVSISVTLLIIQTASIPLEETKSFDINLKLYNVKYNSINDNIIFITIYILLLITLLFHFIKLIKLSKDVSRDTKLSVKTVLFYKDDRMSETRIFIFSIFLITIYYIIYQLLKTMPYSKISFTDVAMTIYVMYMYILTYIFFRSKEERKSFSIRVIITSLVIIYSIVFITIILLKATVLNILYNDTKYTREDVMYNISNGIIYNKNIDYILVKRPENKELGLDSITELLYLKLSNYKTDRNHSITEEKKLGDYIGLSFKKRFVTMGKNTINNIFLVDRFIFNGDEYEIGISYLEMRKTLNNLYTPYFYMYILISMGIFLIYPIFIRKRMNHSLKTLIEVQKAFLSNNKVITKNYIYGKDEFTYLIESFYNTVKNIKNNLSKLEKNNNTIKNYSENLEDVVKSKSKKLENAYKKLEKEEKSIELNMTIALELQKNIWPELPNIKNVQYNFIHKHSNNLINEIFSTVKINEKHIRFFSTAIDKNNIQSAMLAMILKSGGENIKHSLCKPSEVIKELNNILLYSCPSKNISASSFVLDLDLENNELIYSSSAFNKQYYIYDDKVIKLLPTQEDKIGLVKNYKAIDKTIKIHNNIKVILVNKGLFKNYDEKNIYDILMSSSSLNIDEIISNLDKELNAFFDKKETNIYITGINIDNKSDFN